jgi:uncharacterized phage infection (PIP) family protein YhgE
MRLPTLLIAALCVVACDSAGDAADKAKDAADKAAQGTKDAIDGSKQAYDKSKQKVDELSAQAKAGADKVKEGTDKAKALWGDVPESGELSETTKSWLDDQADEGDSTIASVIAQGKQVAPVAAEIGESASKVVDSEHLIEPIYQEVDGDESSEVDKAISDMPRVEVIEGLTIGFKQLDETSADAVVKERGYLVTWREGNHLIGFVYRSKKTIDLEALVAETPRIVGLIRKSVGE